MGPVWEANHVWLIFLLVILFTGFPVAFAALSEAFFIPFHLVLVGIILRGAAFVFRAHGAEEAGPQRVWARAFGSASVITPVLLGMCLGAVSAGQIRIVGGVVQADYWTAWLTPLSWACGALALALFAYLASVYLTLETEGDLREDFRQRTLISGGVVVALAVLLIPLLIWQAPRLAENLLSFRALPVLALGAAVRAAFSVGCADPALRGRSRHGGRRSCHAPLGLGAGPMALHHLPRPDLPGRCRTRRHPRLSCWRQRLWARSCWCHRYGFYSRSSKGATRKPGKRRRTR